ncbi:MAG: flavin reductase family protein [Flavobacteriales bacterium]|jgi:flavin reductase (DIM6/NTAB) family NADH-FMN oxidoreductase RutF|tara:strand:+ start:1928 stop:2821 length:894 start_codon:yes stop_codon:yes gene_type:complete
MNTIKTIDPNDITQQELHAYLLSAVAPRPICFASTIDEKGNINLSPFSFFNVFSSNPPMMIFSPARSGKNNSLKHTHENIKEVPEVVINIVNYDMVEQMSLTSANYDKGVNEFIKSGLTPIPSEKIKPPRVKETPISFECTVLKIIELGDGPGSGNLILAKVELIHVNTKYLNNKGSLDTTLLDLVGRMGENWYIRATKESLFEITKPIKNKGIGVDKLPMSIKESKVLTGNNLGRLANVEQLPSSSEIKTILNEEKNISKLDLNSIHKFAKKELEKGNINKALALLIYAENQINNS